jgi:hypothetical protein
MTSVTPPRPARLLAAVAAACLLVAAGCGDDGGGDGGGEAATATSTTTAAPSTTAPPTTAPPAPGPGGSAFAGGTDPVVVAGTPADTSHLVDVRVAGHDGHDRVVLELDGALPSVDVRYADGPVTASGSGEVVPVDGAAVLTVRLEPASGVDLSGPTLIETYPGPARVRGDTATVTEVVRTGDFEGVLEWAVGLDRRAPFRVSTETAPARVVIDVGAS